VVCGVPSVERIHVDGYVGVSRVGDREGGSFIPPALQRQAIEVWAANRRGCELLEVFEELDKWGLRADRLGLEAKGEHDQAEVGILAAALLAPALAVATLAPLLRRDSAAAVRRGYGLAATSPCAAR
jgi:hypothetical protein